jgi:hypothetical protein
MALRACSPKAVELLDYAPAHHHTVYYSWQSGALRDFRHRNARALSAGFPAG